MRIFARFRPSRAYAGGVAGKKRGGANILNLKEIKTKGCRPLLKTIRSDKIIGIEKDNIFRIAR